MKVEFYVSDNAGKMLSSLVSKGIYGSSVSEIAERIVDAALVQLVKDGVAEIPLQTTKGF